MGQKINPISLRLQTTNRYFDSCWYSDFYYTNLLTYDIKIRSYLDSILKQIDYPSGRFFIQSYKKNSKIFLFFCIPENSRKIRFKLFNLKQHYSNSKKNRKNKNKTKIWFNNKNLQKINKKSHAKGVPIFTSASPSSISNNRFTLINKNLFIRYFLLQNKINDYTSETLYDYTSKVYEKSNKLNIKIFNNVIKQKLNKIQTLVINNKKLQNLELMKQTSAYNIYQPTQSIQVGEPKVKRSNLYTFSVQNKSNTTLYSENSYTFDILSKSLISRSKINLRTPLNLHLPHSLFFINSIFSEFPFLVKSYSYRKHIESVLSKDLNFNINLFPIKIYNDFRSALFIANEIVYYLERRVPFRKIKNRILKECSFLSNIKGLRITCSGRVGGRSKKAQRAKTECIKYGQTSLHIFSSRIDFASKTALTAFGSVGVKVWVCFY